MHTQKIPAMKILSDKLCSFLNSEIEAKRVPDENTQLTSFHGASHLPSTEQSETYHFLHTQLFSPILS